MPAFVGSKVSLRRMLNEADEAGTDRLPQAVFRDIIAEIVAICSVDRAVKDGPLLLDDELGKLVDNYLDEAEEVCYHDFVDHLVLLMPTTAREQERGCYAFCFSGPRQVEEMELGDNPAGLTRLLDFLERTFNGGSNFDEPIKRCLERLLEEFPQDAAGALALATLRFERGQDPETLLPLALRAERFGGGSEAEALLGRLRASPR